MREHPPKALSLHGAFDEALRICDGLSVQSQLCVQLAAKE